MENRAHEGDAFATRFQPQTWRANGTCSYCGSLSPERMAERCANAGTTIDHADQKYGWPHKVYLGGPDGWAKFYNIHLKDATPEQKATIEAKIGIAFKFEDGTVSWRPA